MNAEHILDAMGLVDDDLIQEAERYSRPRGRMAHREWLGLAACFTVVVALVYGLAQLGMSGGNGYSGGMATEGCPPLAPPPLRQGEIWRRQRRRTAAWVMGIRAPSQSPTVPAKGRNNLAGFLEERASATPLWWAVFFTVPLARWLLWR